MSIFFAGVCMELDFSIFKGGWSYMAEEMKNAVNSLPIKDSISVLEFGCGDSSIKLFNLLSKKYKVEYCAYESNPNYKINHNEINCKVYNENDIEKIDLGNKKYDFILIDGPNGVLRKFWYAKIVNNVHKDSVILIDDWCHYQEFEDALVKDFGLRVPYKILETRKEYDPNSDPHLGYKSWKIVIVL